MSSKSISPKSCSSIHSLKASETRSNSSSSSIFSRSGSSSSPLSMKRYRYTCPSSLSPSSFRGRRAIYSWSSVSNMVRTAHSSYSSLSSVSVTVSVSFSFICILLLCLPPAAPAILSLLLSGQCKAAIFCIQGIKKKRKKQERKQQRP